MAVTGNTTVTPNKVGQTVSLTGNAASTGGGTGISGSNVAGGQGSIINGSTTNASNPSTTPAKTASVVTPAAAISDYNNISTANSNIQSGITAQAKNKTAAVPTFQAGDVDKFVKAYQTSQQSQNPMSASDILKAYQGDNAAKNPDNVPTDTSGTNSYAQTNTDGSQNPSSTTGTTTAVTGDYQTDIQNSLNDSANAYNSFISSVNQIKNGVFPLSPVEQALVDSTNTTFNNEIAAQSLVNQNMQSGTAELNARTGVDRYSPAIAASNIASVVNEGISKIADIDSKRVAAVAQLQEGFDTDNYKMISDAYSAYQTYSKSKTDALTALHDDSVKAIETAKTDYYNEVTKPVNDIATEAAKNGASAATIKAINGATDVQGAITAAGDSLQTASGQLGDYLQYKRDSEANGVTAQDYATWKDGDDQKQEELKTDEAYNTAKATAEGKAAGEGASGSSQPTSPITAVGGAADGLIFNAPADVAPYASVSSNGTKYVDMSSFAGTPTEKNAAIADAYAAGFKVITNKNTALDLTNISDANAKLADMKTAFDATNAGDAATRNTYAAAALKAAKLFQTNPDAVGNDVYTDAALDILKAISGSQGFRGGQSIIDQVKATFPQTTDTQAVVDSKIANITKLISDRETALVGKPSAADQAIIDGKQHQDAITDYVTANPAASVQVQQMLGIPGATPDMVYSAFQSMGYIK